MESSNPVFKRGYAAMPGSRGRSAAPTVIDQLEEQFNAPSASTIQTGRMTMEDVVARTTFLFLVLVASGGAAWYFNFGGGFLLIGFLGAFILGMINSFSKKVRPALVIAYAAFEGVALGTLSHVYNTVYPGIISQAIIGTIAAFVGVLALYANGKIRVTPQFTRAMTAALIGYVVLGLFSMISGAFGFGNGYGLYGVSGLGLLLCVGGVALASFFLIVDFDQIQQMIANNAPEQESWRAGFGLMVTVVWLYLEILRLLSILRDER